MSKRALYQAAGRATKKQSASTTIIKALTAHPTRYIYDHRPLKGRKGMTKRKYMQPVEYGDPRYGDAPYEMSVVPSK